MVFFCLVWVKYFLALDLLSLAILLETGDMRYGGVMDKVVTNNMDCLHKQREGRIVISPRKLSSG